MDIFFSNLVLSSELRFRLGRHFSFWFFCLLFFILIYAPHYRSIDPAHGLITTLIESSLFLPLHMFLSYAIIYIAIPQFTKRRYWHAIAWVILSILITAILSILIGEFLIKPLRANVTHFPITSTPLMASLLAGLRGTMTVAGFAGAIKLAKHWYLKNGENERLEKEKLKIELELLKNQLHPHFMFNTLNSIYSLALKNSPNTADAILKLSNLIRYMVSECTAPLISLTNELEIVKTYLELGKTRFVERLDLTVNIQGDLAGKQIAPLMLLPFVENAFKHGVDKTVGQAWMSLDVCIKDCQVKFKLINGKPDEKENSKPIPSGIGLQNVKKRLMLLYPNTHELRISETDETFLVILNIELQNGSKYKLNEN